MIECGHMPAATEISNLVSGANVESPRRSSAAPFTSERPIRKRVSTAVRKAMLESFVNKYRDMNMGKFPSITCAKKEVGGGHYAIRKMLQEIEYDFRTSSVEKGLIKDHKKQTEGENTTGMEISTESSGSQEVSNSQITIVQQLCEDPWTVNNFDNYELKEVPQPSTSSTNAGRSNIRRDDTRNIESHDMKGCHEKLEQKPKYEFPLECPFLFEDSQSKIEKQPDWIENIATENRDTEGQCHGKVEQKLEDKLIDASPLEEKVVSEDLQSKVELHHDGIRSINRDMPEQQKDDELREKPSLWGNLKSLATDLINMWKK